MRKNLRRAKRLAIWMMLGLMITLTSGELFSRYYLGLGTPALFIVHPTIEYMYKPNQDVYRFGNHIIINEYGMRTVPFPLAKGPDELRIMVFGDSVLNGGNLTDHADLATSILQRDLNQANRKAIVGNISAGSWGPGNWIAYAKEYGFFEADVVVLVISSHDYADNPTFQPLDENTHPTKSPISALVEGITRYLPRYLPRFKTEKVTSESDKFPEQAKQVVNEQAALKGLNDLKSFLQLAIKNSTNVLVLQHWEKGELERGVPNPGSQQIHKLCESMGISIRSLAPYFRKSMEQGSNPYRDNIHPNDIGQKLIADAILENLPPKVLTP